MDHLLMSVREFRKGKESYSDGGLEQNNKSSSPSQQGVILQYDTCLIRLSQILGVRKLLHCVCIEIP